MDKYFERKGQLINQMVEHIEDNIFYVTYKSIKIWDAAKRTFRDAIDILRAHKISNMRDQTKIVTNDEINRLLLGKGPDNKRDTGEANELHAIKLGGQEDEKRSKDRVPLKIWKMFKTDAQADLRRGNSINIGLLKDNAAKTGKPEGGVYTHQNKSRAKFLCITQTDE